MTPEQKIDHMDMRLTRIEKLLLQIKTIAIGIAIGIIIAGIIFGIITLREAKEIINTVR